MNSEVYRDICSAQIQPTSTELIRWCFTLQRNNDPKHYVEATQELFKVKWNVLQWPSQSPDLNQIKHTFHLVKAKLKAGRPKHKQRLKRAIIKAWQSITKEETRCFIMSMHSKPSTHCLQSILDIVSKMNNL
ncbi:hypothetical protein JRQ81_016175 [Phrynocephalus forsythii]|uniref:Uncharacterized protein n=1 Tax=Phrynocephalus forsythii TaxID=171643 RepID=A0A9Q0XYN2_9SAUR|nr:hypothetical protein JRQ81_016175 [Phrynocephalus forsythii]